MGKLPLLFSIFLSAGTVAGLILILGADLSAARLAGQNPVWLAASFMVLMLHNVGCGLKWYHLDHLLSHGNTLGSSLKGIFVGGFVNQLVPSSLGGEICRFFLLKSKSGKKVFLTLYMDKSMSHLGWMVLAGCALLSGVSVEGSELTRSLFHVISGAGITVALLLSVAGAGLTVRKLSWMALIMQIMFSVFLASLIPLSLWFCFRAAGFLADFGDFFIRGCLLLMILAIPVGVANWGGRELGMLLLFQGFGAGNSSLIFVSVSFGILGFLSFLPGLFLAVVSLKNVHTGKKRSEQSICGS